MHIRGDDRAVTVQVGAVLLFGMVVVSMSIYQATAVPDHNQGVEFDHNQRVQDEMREVRDSILRSAATGASQPASVTLGTRYPERALFVNPPPASGNLRTAALGDVAIGNATATDGETADYWDGSERRFSTRLLVYSPGYHRYSNAPETIYEHSLLYNRFDNGANLTLSGQQLVDGRRITLVALNGSLSESGTAAAGVTPSLPSPSTTTVRTTTVESGDRNVTLRVPTRLSASHWAEALADEDRVLAVKPDGADAVAVVLEPGEYDLRMAKVGLGTGVSAEREHYVTDVEGDERSVYEGTSQTLVVEVRDRFNNPVSGVTVNESDENVVPVSPTTDSTGRATFRYEAPAVSQDEDVSVELSFGANDAERKRVVFDLHVESIQPGQGNSGGNENGDGGNDENGAAANIKYVSGSGLAKANGGPTSGVQFKVSNTGSSDATVTDIVVEVKKDSSTKKIQESNGGPPGDGQSEVFIDATTDGWLEMDCSNCNDPGTPYNLETKEPLTQSSELAGDSEATLYMYQFQKNNGDSVDMYGKEVMVTLYFADGSSKEFVFTPENPDN